MGAMFRILQSIPYALALMLGLATPCAAAEEPGLYRCTSADGRIEFRQFPCHGRDDSLRLELNDRPSGWIPPDPSEVFQEDPRPEVSSAADRSADTARKAAAVDRRREEKCWKKEHQLDQVNRKLRAGYQASEGNRLRAKRREYQDYLKRFCD